MSDQSPTFAPPPAPPGVPAAAWSNVCLADLLAERLSEHAPPSRVVRYRLDHDVRATITQLLLPACGGQQGRAEEIINTCVREGQTITAVFTRLHEEWQAAARRFRATVTVPESGDELTVTELPDGSIQLFACTGGEDHDPGTGHATVTLPRYLMNQLVTRYTGHKP